MEELQGNSNASKRVEKEKLAPVTTNVTVKKESAVSKIGKKFIAEDAKSAGAYVFESVVVPTIQKLITDGVKTFIDWIIYGRSGGTTTRGGVSHVSYSSYYDKPKPTPQQTTRPSVYTVNEIIFDNRGDAEQVLLRLKEAVQRYGMVSVSDVYDLIDQQCEYTARKYGWRDLSTAEVIRKANGYIITFPKVVPLD